MSAVLKDFAAMQAASAALAPPDAAEAMRRARVLLAPSMKDRTAPAYPVHALGPLAAACAEIIEAGQLQPAMVGQCLLGAASLLTQGLFNVETLVGPRPLSLYLLTLGDSGDGKSTAQGAALASVNEWQRVKAKAYREALDEFERATASRKKGEAPAEAPACTYRLCGDSTVEGLRRDLDTGICSQGVFSDEAAAILSGYGMSADHRSKTAGVFSKLWDAGHLSVSRVTGGRVERYGRRIALHWLIQPMAAAESIGDPLLSALGFWPRFLVAWPAPQAPRIYKPFRPDTLPAVGAYRARCDELLAVPLGDDAGEAPVLKLSDEARVILSGAFEQFEQQARRGGLRSVKAFALRASEQACRIAGVLAAFGGNHAVSADDMRGALALVAYSLKTWQAIIDGGAADQGGAAALRLYEYLLQRPSWCESLALIVNGGPGCLRSKDKRDAALAMLESVGLVLQTGGKAIAQMGADAP